MNKKNLLIGIIIFFSVLGVSVLLLLFTYWFFNPLVPRIKPGDGLNKPDWLVFWGSILGFIGTFFLGFLSLRFNNKANEVNKKLAEQNSISNFHSFLEPYSFEIYSPLLKNNEIIDQIPESGQKLANKTKENPIVTDTNFVTLNIRFTSSTDFFPIEYKIESMEIFKQKGPKDIYKLFFLEQFKNDKLKYCFHFDSEDKRQYMLVHFPIDSTEKDIFEVLKNDNTIRIDIEYSFENPFGIESTCKSIIHFSEPMIDGDWINFHAEGNNLLKYSCRIAENSLNS